MFELSKTEFPKLYLFERKYSKVFMLKFFSSFLRIVFKRFVQKPTRKTTQKIREIKFGAAKTSENVILTIILRNTISSSTIYFMIYLLNASRGFGMGRRVIDHMSLGHSWQPCSPWVVL